MATSTASSITTTFSEAATPLFSGACFVHGQSSSLELLTAKHGNRLYGVILCGHFHESKPPGPARRAVLHDVDGIDATGFCEQVLQIVFSNVEGEIANE
jgi:hypothetical protein